MTRNRPMSLTLNALLALLAMALVLLAVSIMRGR